MISVPHIELQPGLPGIIGLFEFRPETAEPLGALAEVLLRGPSTLSRGERELIATVVSSGNDCYFCTSAHGAIAEAQLDDGPDVLGECLRDPDSAPVSGKLRALLRIAETIRQGTVDDGAVDAAKAAGASDIEIHDTVLIAAAFCMFNRYVDGLATVAPEEPEQYREMARRILVEGYPRAAQQPVS
jgi:uncharacterized peroxidase-related enzyme